MVKLSIVIPVYRTASTLQRCIESVVSQSFRDIEVILVDDGSPDASPQMCDEWARRDRRVTVIHKDNGGLSDARNAGIDIARGALITFVDSDDFLLPDTYQQVLSHCGDADIVEFPISRFHGSPRQSLLSFDDRLYTDQADYWLQGQGYSHTYACNKIFRRSLFDNIRFPKGKVFEDVATLPLLLQAARTIATTHHGRYYYCLNSEGITATAAGTQLEQLLSAHLITMQQWCDDRYYMHVLNIQMDVCELTGRQPLLTPRHISVISPGLSATQRVKALMLNLIGLNAICQLNKILHRWIKHRS